MLSFQAELIARNFNFNLNHNFNQRHVQFWDYPLLEKCKLKYKRKFKKNSNNRPNLSRQLIAF